MVLQNRDETMIFAAYRYIFHCNDALEAEIHAIMQGMALAIQHSDMPVIVQSDSSNALATLTDATLSRSAVILMLRLKLTWLLGSLFLVKLIESRIAHHIFWHTIVVPSIVLRYG